VTPLVYGEQHLAVIGADGVPVDTAAVQQARAEHSVHKLNAQLRNGDLVHVAHAVVATPVVHGLSSVVPLETPEVVAAKINHFAAHAEALARNNHVHGVPVETEEVQQAKAAHYAAVAEAAARNGYATAPFQGGYSAPAQAAPQYAPANHHVQSNSVFQPVDTVEVQQARAAHFAAVAEAEARENKYSAPSYGQQYQHQQQHVPSYVPQQQSYVPQQQQSYVPQQQQSYVPQQQSYYGHQQQQQQPSYQNGLHIPVISNGVPVETPEVQQAKAAHLDAYAKASAQSQTHSHY
ncbi:PREDICTED: pupal cuticle protein-like, partial [Nicrophorus vespilloides]|uniref:Pupal cuticle protein-like n=1 Tax=Nicrophorus vespilloides TaxID=110193 RepID=A0ABM1NIG0_NICVS